MRDTLQAPGRRNRSWPDATANSERKCRARSPRLARHTIGFWLGGGLLGTGGCILGVCMPYHHPVAVVLSALWWGISLGCLGASVGALIVWLTGRAPPQLSATWDGAGIVPTELELDSGAGDAGSTAVGAPRGPRGLPGPEPTPTRS